MSAFDIAGAVVWTPLAICWWLMFGWALKNINTLAGEAYLAHGIISTLFSAASVYCIARLFGAHP